MKRTVEVGFDYEGDYVPDDSFCIACPNDDAELAELAELAARLGCTAVLNKWVALSFDPNTTRRSRRQYQSSWWAPPPSGSARLHSATSGPR